MAGVQGSLDKVAGPKSMLGASWRRACSWPLQWAALHQLEVLEKDNRNAWIVPADVGVGDAFDPHVLLASAF